MLRLHAMRPASVRRPLTLSLALLLACAGGPATSGSEGASDASGSGSAGTGGEGPAPARVVDVAEVTWPTTGVAVAFHGARGYWAYTSNGRLYLRGESSAGAGAFVDVEAAPMTAQSLEQPLLASDGATLCVGAWMFLGEVGIHLWCRDGDDAAFVALPRAAADVGLVNRRATLQVVDGAPLLAYPKGDLEVVVERWSGATWEPLAAPLAGAFTNAELAGAGPSTRLVGFRGSIDPSDRLLTIARLSGGAWATSELPELLASGPEVVRLAVAGDGAAVLAAATLAEGSVLDDRGGALTTRATLEGALTDLSSDGARPGVVVGVRISSLTDPNAGLRDLVTIDAAGVRSRPLDDAMIVESGGITNPVGPKQTRIAAHDGRVLVAFREERTPNAALLLEVAGD